MAASTFPRFRELPMELQDQIWGHAIDNADAVAALCFGYDGWGRRLGVVRVSPRPQGSFGTAPDFRSLTIAKLKVLLRARRLRVGGNKTELITRLYDHDEAQRKAGNVLNIRGYRCLFAGNRALCRAPRSGECVYFSKRWYTSGWIKLLNACSSSRLRTLRWMKKRAELELSLEGHMHHIPDVLGELVDELDGRLRT